MTPSSPPLRTRGAHEGSVLKSLRDDGPTSRTKLSNITGLSPTTITKTVLPMLESGLLIERPDEYTGLGRPAVTLVPDPDAVTVAGVQIGVGKVRLGLSNAEGVIRSSRTYSFDLHQPAPEVLSDIADALTVLLEEDDGATCIGVGVGAPGPVDADRRRTILSINLGWRDVAISDLLETRIGLPVVVDHNVRSFALGEARYGDHRADSLAYVYVRTGVGFGIAVRGEPFYGGPGGGGESYLGHLRVVENGLPCSCGARGCLETIVAEPYLDRELEAIRGPSPAGAEIMRELHRIATNVSAAADLESTVIERLGEAVATIVNLFTPDLVLVGGALSALPPASLSRLDLATRERIFPLLRETLRVETASGDDNSLVRGAAAIALEVLHYS